MAHQKTQCPHCFISYLVSDEQIRASAGVVRCGTCREQFNVDVSPADAIAKFDPRDFFIEPLSEDADGGSGLSADDGAEIRFDDVEPPNPDRELSLDSELSLGVSDTSLSSPSEIDATAVDKTQEILANIRAREAKQFVEASESTDAAARFDDDDDGALTSDPHAVKDSSKTTNEAQLINEVDALVQRKLMTGKNQLSHDSITVEDEPFLLIGQKPRNSGLSRWLALPFLSIACLVLTLAFVYQLWLKQAVFLNPGSSTERFVTSVASELAGQLSDSNVALPVRRDLSKMELVSARTQPHPSRASTILLQVALINHAKIEQSMPWLELTLFDSQGGLLSRRNLPPTDYGYNNSVELMMKPREYRRLSIELLAFPSEASGYELKLLNR